MYASVWPSESAGAAGPHAPRRQRAEGRIRMRAACIGGRTQLADLAESGSARLRLPRPAGAALEAVTINTGGGIAGGDRFETRIAAGAGADVTVTSTAAEKLYRSDGSAAHLDLLLSLEAGARLDWIPQETIIFDGARARRRVEAELAGDARLLLFEAVVFGRAARGERIGSGFFEDRWRIRREGRLLHADTFRLAGRMSDLLERPALGGGAAAIATLIYVAPDAEAQLEEVRGGLDAAACECGASAWNGLLAIRFLGQDSERLRRDAARIITGLGGRPMPRVWQA
jgi:urease accessory protein